MDASEGWRNNAVDFTGLWLSTAIMLGGGWFFIVTQNKSAAFVSLLAATAAVSSLYQIGELARTGSKRIMYGAGYLCNRLGILLPLVIFDLYADTSMWFIDTWILFGCMLAALQGGKTHEAAIARFHAEGSHLFNPAQSS